MSSTSSRRCRRRRAGSGCAERRDPRPRPRRTGTRGPSRAEAPPAAAARTRARRAPRPWPSAQHRGVPACAGIRSMSRTGAPSAGRRSATTASAGKFSHVHRSIARVQANRASTPRMKTQRVAADVAGLDQPQHGRHSPSSRVSRRPLTMPSIDRRRPQTFQNDDRQRGRPAARRPRRRARRRSTCSTQQRGGAPRSGSAQSDRAQVERRTIDRQRGQRPTAAAARSPCARRTCADAPAAPSPMRVVGAGDAAHRAREHRLEPVVERVAGRRSARRCRPSRRRPTARPSTDERHDHRRRRLVHVVLRPRACRREARRGTSGSRAANM